MHLVSLWPCLGMLAILGLSACGGGGGGGGGGQEKPDEPGEKLEGVHLSVSDGEARSCELIVLDPEAAIARVEFSGDVLGSSVTQGPKVAVSFLRKADKSIGDSAVTLQVRASAGTGELSTKSVTCFDAKGAALDGAKVKIVQ